MGPSTAFSKVVVEWIGWWLKRHAAAWDVFPILVRITRWFNALINTIFDICLPDLVMQKPYTLLKTVAINHWMEWWNWVPYFQANLYWQFWRWLVKQQLQTMPDFYLFVWIYYHHHQQQQHQHQHHHHHHQQHQHQHHQYHVFPPAVLRLC